MSDFAPEAATAAGRIAERENEERLRLALDAGGLGTWDYDPVTGTLAWDDRCCALFGLGRDAGVSYDTFLSGVHPDDRDRVDGAVRAALDPDRGQAYDVEYRTVGIEDGVVRWVAARGRPVFDDERRARRFIGTVADITSRKNAEAENARLLDAQAAVAFDNARLLEEARRAEAELEKGERRLRIALDAADLGMWEWDFETGAVVWSERNARLFGFGPGEFDGTYDAVLARIHPDDRARATEDVRRALRDGSIYEDEFRIVQPDGTVLWIAARGQIVEPAGGTRRMAGVCMDVTERRRTEELRAEAFAREQQARIQLEAASRAKDEFLAVVSHELRTPLNSILGWARLLRTGNLDEQTISRAIDTIERNVRSQAQLIEDLLDVSRIISGKLRVNTQPLAPATFVEAALDIVRPAAEAKEIALSFERPTSLPLVLGDAERLQQVAWNLLSNAVKFTSRGGRVDVRLAGVDASVELTVTDTGQGIPADFLPYAFDPFRQADSAATRIHKGLGLGLAIVRHLVELHGGSVTAESGGAGLGSIFRVRLPVTAVRPSPGKSEPSATCDQDELGQLPVLAGVHILVVEDEPDTRAILGLALERAGATVVTTASAAEARAALDAAAFDVLVSDIGMPEEDGYDLIRSIRARPIADGGRIPAIALTAFARPEDRVQALAAGFEMHVAKPVDSLELAMTIKSLTSLAGRSTDL